MSYTNGLDDPSLYFNTLLYTGTGSTNSVSGVGFSPDWVWIKNRDATDSHRVTDTVRGVAKEMYTNGTFSEDPNGGLTSFDSDGFTLNTNSSYNGSGVKYVSWNWLAGGSASSNSNGTITSSVSASTVAGFSVATYTGNGTSGATFGHGLSSAPEMVWLKQRNSAGNWRVGATPVDSTFNQVINVNLGNAPASASSIFNSTAPSSTLVTLGNEGDANGNTNTFVAYCFHSVKGYSKIGKYTGNNSSSGTFLYLGFSPAMVIIKDISSTDPWHIIDNKRSPRNLVKERLFPSSNGAENTSADICDFVSNGIKFRGTNDGFNGSRNYLYMAFAESPFVNSNGVPNNAR